MFGNTPSGAILIHKGAKVSVRRVKRETEGLLAAIRREATVRGFDLVGVVDAADYDAAAPPGHRIGDVWAGACAAIVIGNAGPRFWDRFRGEQKGRLDRVEGEDPLDAFTVRETAPLRALITEGGFTERTVYPFFGATDHALSFRELGIAAGFGVRSVLGLVLSPVYGPWIASRAAVLTDAPLAPAGRQARFDPCTTCPAPCIDVCPGDAFPGRQWSPQACLTAKSRLEPCRTRCLSRIHCVYGSDYRYTPEETAYHDTYPVPGKKDR